MKTKSNIQKENQRASNICKRCGRKLKNPESIEIGFGPVCYSKSVIKLLQKSLFEVMHKNDK